MVHGSFWYLCAISFKRNSVCFRMEIEKYEMELEEGKRQLRRGRFDVIEEELLKYKYQLDRQTLDLVERMRGSLEQEYNRKLKAAFDDRTTDSSANKVRRSFMCTILNRWKMTLNVIEVLSREFLGPIPC